MPGSIVFDGAAPEKDGPRAPRSGAVYLPARPPDPGVDEGLDEESSGGLKGAQEEEPSRPRFAPAPRGNAAAAPRAEKRAEEKEGERKMPVPRSLSEVSTSASSGADEARRGREAAIEAVRKHAVFPNDLAILSRFLDLQHLDGHKTLASDPPPLFLRLVLRAMKLLRYCEFQEEEVCCILAHASVYFRSAHRACGDTMDGPEVAYVMVALTYIAHAYIQDETCPLRVWHEHIFKNYCDIKKLNLVILRLMEIREYRLRVDRKEMMKRCKYLSGLKPLSSMCPGSTDPKTAQ